MTSKQLYQNAKMLKGELLKVRTSAKNATVKDIVTILKAYDKNGFNLETVQKTRLYNSQGSVYCSLLELIAKHKKSLKIHF